MRSSGSLRSTTFPGTRRWSRCRCPPPQTRISTTATTSASSPRAASASSACGCTPTRTSWTASPAAVVGGEQRTVRASRALRPRVDVLEVGPLRLTIVEPMRRQRLELAENPTGVDVRRRDQRHKPRLLRESRHPLPPGPADQSRAALHAARPRRRQPVGGRRRRSRSSAGTRTATTRGAFARRWGPSFRSGAASPPAAIRARSGCGCRSSSTTTAACSLCTRTPTAT